MKIIKRNGAEVPFDITKIITAVGKASESMSEQNRLTRDQITQIAADVADQCQALNRAVNVEEIQDMVENQLMDIQAHDVARHYITYRYVQSLEASDQHHRRAHPQPDRVPERGGQAGERQQNPTVNSVQRDYMAGEISKDLTNRLLLAPDIVKAHQEGLIPLPRLGLFCPAYAQLRSGEPGGYAAERHRHLRYLYRSPIASPPPATSPPRSLPRWPPTSTAVRASA